MSDYRSLDALNWSTLKEGWRDHRPCPLMWAWRRDHPRPDSPALSLGRLVHLAILEPDRYETDAVRRPDEWDSWRTKAAREWRDEQLAAGREILDDDTAEVVEIIRGRIAAHQEAVRCLEGARTEETIQWTDPVTGVRCKGRVDAIASDRIVDLKTVGKGLGYFERRGISDYLYHGQLAWYLDGAVEAGACSPDADVYVVAVETTEPYDVGAYRLTGRAVEAGRALYRTLLDLWASCRETGMYPGSAPVLRDLDVPERVAGSVLDEEVI